MGIALPGALAAKLTNPNKRVLVITGDAGFMMNSQEIETALRHKLAFVVMIWEDISGINSVALVVRGISASIILILSNMLNL